MVDFDKLTKALIKYSNVFANEKIPRFIIRTLTHLEDSVNQAASLSKDAKKKMNASNAKAMNSMKQKIKKYNKSYEADIESFRAVNTSFVKFNNNLSIESC